MFKLGNVETVTNQPGSRHPSGSVDPVNVGGILKPDGGLQSAFVEPLQIKLLVNLCDLCALSRWAKSHKP